MYKEKLDLLIKHIKRITDKTKYHLLRIKSDLTDFTKSNFKKAGVEDEVGEPTEENLNSKKIAQRQSLNAIAIFAAFCLIAYVFINFGNNNSKSSSQYSAKEKKQKINVELANKSLDPEILWRNHFEDKLEEEKTKTETKISKLLKAFDTKSDDTLQEARNDTESLRFQMSKITDRLEEISSRLDSIGSNSDREKEEEIEEKIGKIDITKIYDEDNISLPRSISNYIPETSYVKGTLLGGISVSTGVQSSAEPVPVVIRLNDRGNLPKKFDVDIKECRILGSAYGDLSSERAVVRAESMVCENKKLGEVLTTKIAGIVYGDDGANGIKGRVVDMSQKHVKNAAIGGLLSGFSGSMKSQGNFSLSSLGAISTKEPSFGQKMKDNTMEGMGNAAEKIADYYIRQAENMSPTLNIPGGTKVDVVFLKGVYLGSTNIANLLEKKRRGNEPD